MAERLLTALHEPHRAPDSILPDTSPEPGLQPMTWHQLNRRLSVCQGFRSQLPVTIDSQLPAANRASHFKGKDVWITIRHEKDGRGVIECRWANEPKSPVLDSFMFWPGQVVFHFIQTGPNAS